MSPAPHTPENQFLAELLTARAEELGERAARALGREFPNAGDGFAPLAGARWPDHLAARIHDLAAAVGVARPEMFAAQAEWSRAAWLARGLPIDRLRASLVALHRILQDEACPEDRPTIDRYFADALRSASDDAPAPPPLLSTDTPEGRLGARYLLAILEGDRHAATSLIVSAVTGGADVRSIYLNVLARVQHELGRMWHLGEINVAEEHFATVTTQTAMAQILPLASRKPANGRAVLAASVQGNAHDLGARMVADFFEMDGWRAVCPGSDVPRDDLVNAASDFAVDLVALSAALPAHLHEVQETIALLRSSPQASDRARRPVIVGGNAFGTDAELWRDLGADGYAPSADRAVELARSLLARG